MRRVLRNHRLAVIGGGLLVLIVATVLAAPLLAPSAPAVMDVRDMLAPPSPAHPLGTDLFGRDVLSRTLYGGRVTLAIGVLVVGLAFGLGVTAGALSGFIGGWPDLAVMRLCDAMLSFPALILAIALAAALGPSLANAALAVALTLAPQFARLARAQSQSQMTSLHVEAARAAGLPSRTIFPHYVLRNGLGPLITQASLSVGAAILQTSSLGFLGLGAQPPLAEWGADIAANLEAIRGAPWVVASPGLAILATVLAFNLLGDALTETFNPRLRKP